jgi:hypothetical protein
MKKVKQIINNIHSSSAVVSEPDLQKVLDYYMNNQVLEQINTTITASSSLNYGNIYYISAASGNNTTAMKGDPQKPYATFSAVAALYQDSEIIHILDGTANATSVTNLNNKTNIKIILNESTTLQNFSYVPTVTGFDVSIFGNGQVTGGGVTTSLTKIGDYNVNVDSILEHFIVNHGGNIHFECNYLELNSQNSVQYADNSLVNTNIKNTTIIANNSYIGSEAFRNGASGSSAKAENVNLVFKTNYMELSGTGFFVFWNCIMENVNMQFDIKTLKADVDFLLYHQSDNQSYNNVNINVNIGYYKGTASLFGDWGPGEYPSGQALNSVYKVHADFYHCTRTTASLLKNITIYEQPARNSFFIISGLFFVDSVPLLSLTTALGCNYLFTGTFKTTGVVPAFNLTTIGGAARLNLENAKFIVASGQKVIEATGASNVYCMNVVTNSTTTDAEVTEVGQAIVRNANFV